MPSCDDFLLTLVGLFMEYHIEGMGDTTNYIHLLFEAKFSFVSVVTNSCTLTPQGTLCLPFLASGDEFLTNISGFFFKSHTVDLEDFFDDIQLLFDEDDPSIVFTRSHSNPHVHSLHDQSLQSDVVVDTYVQ